MDILALTPAIGAEIKGIQLNQSISNSIFTEIKNALLRYQVIFFRQQFIEPHHQKELAEKFGPLHIHPIFPSHPDIKEIMVLDSHQQDLRDNELWHTDVTFLEKPAMGCILSAIQVPCFGGDTLWASGTAAYEDLSDGMKIFLEGLTASHDISLSFPESRFGQDEVTKKNLQAAINQHPPQSHPVIRTHPETGAKSLFISEGFTKKINELSTKESDAILKFLFAHSSQPKYFLRWHWQNGDVAIWDNRCTQHFANFDYGHFHRIMQRATVLGDVPY